MAGGSLRRRLHGRRHRQHPSQAAGARFSKIQAPVHEDAREPDFEGIFLAIARDVRKHLDERVLDSLVGIVCVTQIAVCDTDCASLMLRDQVAELLPGAFPLASEHERFEASGQRRIP